MAETILATPAAALALLPINTTGQIGAQDLRDIAASVPYIGEGMWDDIQGDISQGTGNADLTYEAYRDTPLKLYHWSHNQADELHMRYQMSHRWAGTAVKPHLHFVPMAAGSGTFAVKGQYAWVSVGDVLGANATWTAFTASVALTAADQYRSKILGLATINPQATPKASDILLVYMVRDIAVDTYETSKPSGTAAANVGLLSADVHYQSKTLGSIAEYGDT